MHRNRSGGNPGYSFLLCAVGWILIFNLIAVNSWGEGIRKVIHLDSLDAEQTPHTHGGNLPAGQGGQENLFTEVLNQGGELSLTEGQVRRIQKHEVEFQKRKIRLEAELDIAKIDFYYLSRSMTARESELHTLSGKIQELQGQLMDLELSVWATLQTILTPEQKERLGRLP